MLEIYRKKEPLVTVILPTFNRFDYLTRSISSFLSQTFTQAELLVVDDGSEDKTFLLVKDFMDKHPNIRYLRHTNRKLSLTKNAGIKAAAGKYIGFLDSDDEYKPDYLEKRVEYMEAHPEVDIIEGGVIVIGDPYVKDINDLSQKIHLSECHIGATFFGKANVFTELDGFDKDIFYGEDSLFLEKALENFNVKKIDHPGYVYYRMTPDSISNSV